jgi:peptide/nickel transport system permease protein
MLRFALTRIAMAVPTLLIVAVSVFVLIRLIPGDPASLMLGDLADPASLADLRARLGLDQGIVVQFAIWFGHLLQGDLGQSITSGEAVLPLILSRFTISAQVVLAAVLLASLVAVPAGVIAAWRQNSKTDVAVVATASCCCCSSGSSSAGCRSSATSRSARTRCEGCCTWSCRS